MAAVAVWLAHPTAARAQVVIGPAPGGAAFGGGLGFSYQRSHFRAFGFAGAYSSRFYSFPAFPVLPPFAAVGPLGFPGAGCFGPPLGWNSPWGGGFWGPTWSWSVSPAPVFVVPPPIVLAGAIEPPERDFRGAVVIRPDDPPRAEPPRLLRNEDFLVVEPRKAAIPPPGKVVPEVDRVERMDQLPQLPPPRPDPFAAPKRIDRDRPDPDPAREAARLLRLGRDAFVRGEYGRAGELFGRAAASDPKSAEARFLAAQAALAAGAYAEAVAAVRAGLALDPVWPAGLFDPKEPYGAGAGRYAEHLAELRKAVGANPREAEPAFLLGYQLWFVGEKAEARKWFAAAEPRLAGPEVLALFR